MTPSGEQPSEEQARRGLFELYRGQRRLIWIQAQGGSMRPVIRPGTWFEVQFGALPSRAGEIVVFTTAERLVAHRVVSVADDVLLTKGDANRRFDPPVHLAQVIGTVRARKRTEAARRQTLGCSGLSAWIAAQLSSCQGRLAGRFARRYDAGGNPSSDRFRRSRT